MFGFRGATVGGGPLLQFPNDLVRNAANRQLGHNDTSNEGAVIEGILTLLAFHEDQGGRLPASCRRTGRGEPRIGLSARWFRRERR